MSQNNSQPFDPWSATFEEAQAAHGQFAPLEGPARPIYQWSAAHEITAMRAEAESSGFAVLACVRNCANHDLTMPLWLAHAFIRRYDSVLNCRADSWDDPAAFGKPYPKGAHLSKLRHARVHRFQVHSAVVKAVQENPKRPIGRKLFSEVGKALGMKSTTVQTYYYEAAKLIGYGAKGTPRSRSEARDKAILSGSASLARLRWGG